MLKASPDSYGLIARLFHWVLARVILWQLFTGINLNQMEPSVEKGAIHLVSPNNRNLFILRDCAAASVKILQPARL